jgi:2-oxoglutarate ferredoxin oxidoreductase subunit alpha
MQDTTRNVVIGGEAGQGLVTVGQLLARILVRSGYSITVTQSYQSRIRGGHNSFAVRAGARQVEAPAEAVDVLVALNKETAALHKDELADDGLIIAEASFCVQEDCCLDVPYGELADEKFRNIVALGIICAVLGLDRDIASSAVSDTFGDKHPEALEDNLGALGRGFEWAGKQTARSRALSKPSGDANRLMLNGNQAIALGAVSAGLRFCSYYPMTPATSVPLTLVEVAERMGIVVEQVEDEISAVNMAIGASYAGAPSMVATSGGGFALMVEGISLAGMTETPLVVVVAQRPGPATGLPTRTEQADLEFVLHAGHGEFPRTVFSPGTVEDCFSLIRRAFDMAERFQGPVFVLTDQFLADSYRAVEPIEIFNLDWIEPGADPGAVTAPYLRHAVTENGVSPRLLPNTSDHLVVTDSDEHTDDGHLTEDLTVRKQQVDKRLQKSEGIAQEILPPDLEGDDQAVLLLVSWGSSKGAVREAASMLRAEGEKVASLHFKQVWPLDPRQFLSYLKQAKRVVCIEGNATGQLARLIRRESGFEIEEMVLRYDGLPITPGYIVRGLRRERR